MKAQGEAALAISKVLYLPTSTTTTPTNIFALHATQIAGSAPPAAPSGPSYTGGGSTPPAAPSGPSSTGRGGHSNFNTADKNVRHTGGVDTITANATLHFSTGSSGEIIATPEVLCPCGLRPPFDSRGPCCSMTCHKKYVTDVAANQTDSSLLDEITRRLQVTMTYQHILVCAVAAHAAANDGSEFIPPAPPRF